MTEAVDFINTLPGWFLTTLVVGCGMVITALIGLMAWFFRDTWGDMKTERKNQTKALIANTLSIQKLELQMERLNELLNLLPKLRSDVDMAHSKIRELNGRPRS